MALRIEGFQRIRKMSWSPLGASSARQTRSLHEPTMNNLFNWDLWGFFFFFFWILDSCCLDAKKIFKTEINVRFDE